MNILLAMIPAFLWGTTYAVTQYTLHDWPPLLLGALRALPAGIILFMLKPTLPARENWPVLCSIGFINIAVFFSLIFVMALTLPSAISGVGMVAVPVFAMIYHWLINKVKPKKIQAISGAILILLAWLLFDPSSISLNPIGLVAMLGAISCIIVGSTIVKGLGGKIHWWEVLTWQLIIGGLMLAIASMVQMVMTPEPYQVVIEQFSQKNLVGLVWIIVLNTAVGYGLYVWLLQKMSVVDFTFGSIANPIAGILSGMILVGENFTWFQYCLMFGMILMSLMPQLVALVRRKQP
ncbi:EamA family transporter [Shewanella olleyana]|uniref:DMT family transporter n=1 Tax=Shewanella olleyana TaxID=135626 RepID=UPI00200CBDF7|nr:EamA family transporter [Shewanella olleyana]MCL1068634.1 EamA family transporter [Shewanella olleyana]